MMNDGILWNYKKNFVVYREFKYTCIIWKMFVEKFYEQSSVDGGKLH